MVRSNKISKLKAKLDKYFSQYIRWKYMNEDGLVQCYTCGTYKALGDIQCGHFLSRRYLSVRWDEDNARPQCVKCNMFSQGRQYEFGKKLEKEIGKDRVSLLLKKKTNRVKMTSFEYELLIKEYKQKLNEIPNT